jgi:hypothetical protein
MEYRGKHFTILQGVGPGSWKWTVQLDERSAKSGEAPSRAAAMNSVVWFIDKMLRPKGKTGSAGYLARLRMHLATTK